MSKNEHKYADGSRYNGTWSDDGQRDGHGTLTYANGATYNGEFSRGLQEGFGVMVIPEG